MKKYKVLDIHCEGVHFECIFDSTTNNNPYTLYLKSRDESGMKHKNKIVSYQNFVSVLEWLTRYAHYNNWGFCDCFQIGKR